MLLQLLPPSLSLWVTQLVDFSSVCTYVHRHD